jgi:hypothetical protein
LRYSRRGILRVDPRSPKCLSHRIAAGGPGIAWGWTPRRVGDASPIQLRRFLRSCGRPRFRCLIEPRCETRSDGVLGRPPRPWQKRHRRAWKLLVRLFKHRPSRRCAPTRPGGPPSTKVPNAAPCVTTPSRTMPGPPITRAHQPRRQGSPDPHFFAGGRHAVGSIDPADLIRNLTTTPNYGNIYIFS